MKKETKPEKLNRLIRDEENSLEILRDKHEDLIRQMNMRTSKIHDLKLELETIQIPKINDN